MQRHSKQLHSMQQLHNQQQHMLLHHKQQHSSQQLHSLQRRKQQHSRQHRKQLHMQLQLFRQRRCLLQQELNKQKLRLQDRQQQPA